MEKGFNLAIVFIVGVVALVGIITLINTENNQNMAGQTYSKEVISANAKTDNLKEIYIQEIIDKVNSRKETISQTPITNLTTIQYYYNLPGWPIQLPAPIAWSSPVYADLDNDNQNEIIIGCRDSKVYVFKKNGSQLPGWPVVLSSNYDSLYSSPAVSDINNDGYKEVIISTILNSNSYIYIIAHNGQILNGGPTLIADSSSPIVSPVVADLDGDGFKEIIYSSFNQINVITSMGTIKNGWPHNFENQEWTQSDPSVADINNDGKLEVLFTSVRTENDNNSYTKLYLFNADGSSVYGWPKILKDPTYKQYWRTAMTPAIGDIDADGKLEIIVLDSYYLYIIKPNGDYDLVFDMYENINDLGIYPKDPVLLDSNNNGKLEIVVLEDQMIILRNEDGNITIIRDIDPSGISTADLDGDGVQEIIGGDWYSGLYAWKTNGSIAKYFPIPSGGLIGTPLIFDFNSNGKIDILTGSTNGLIYAWEINSPYLFSNNDWPSYQHDNQHTNNYNFDRYCSNKVKYGSCVTTQKPKMCINGILINKCSICGCSVGSKCNLLTEKCI